MRRIGREVAAGEVPHSLPFLYVVLYLITPHQLANAYTPYIGDVQLSRAPRPEARGEELSQTAKPIFSGKLP